jgi:hypothetical protein
MFTSLITATNLFKFTDGASTSNLRPRNLMPNENVQGCDLSSQRQCHGPVCVPITELCPGVTCKQCTQVGEDGKSWKWNTESNKCMSNCSEERTCITNINDCNGVSQEGAGTDVLLPNQVFNLQPGAVLNVNPVSDNTTVNPGPDGNTMIKIDNSAVVNPESNAVGTPPATLQALSIQSPTFVFPQDCETCYAAGMKWQDDKCDFECYILDEPCYCEEHEACPGTLSTGSTASDFNMEGAGFKRIQRMATTKSGLRALCVLPFVWYDTTYYDCLAMGSGATWCPIVTELAQTSLTNDTIMENEIGICDDIDTLPGVKVENLTNVVTSYSNNDDTMIDGKPAFERKFEDRRCTDDETFKDEGGATCGAWETFKCTDAVSIYKYSPEGQEELLKKCQKTCNSCSEVHVNVLTKSL